MHYVQGMMYIIKKSETGYIKFGRLDRESNLGPSACRADVLTTHYTTENMPTSCVQIATSFNLRLHND